MKKIGEIIHNMQTQLNIQNKLKTSIRASYTIIAAGNVIPITLVITANANNIKILFIH